MRLFRSIASTAASLSLAIVVAACAPAAVDEPSPSAPAPTAPEPAGSPTASPTPEESPSQTPDEVVEFDLPMIGRSTDDGVDVYARPSFDAPLLIGQAFPDMSDVEISLEADEPVSVTLGPLVSEGTSWYQVHAVDGGRTAFGFGWVPADSLARESDSPDGGPQVFTTHGQGGDGEISMDVPMGTPVTVDVAYAPMTGDDTCDLDVTVIRTDGLGVNVATQTVTEPDAFQFGASIDYGGLQSLFQEEAGTVTLQVETDCSWAASLTQPPA
jgi:hypothetical protein